MTPEAPGFSRGVSHYVYCATQLFVQADKEINDVYRELVGKLNAEGRSVLRTSQLAWIKSRNQQCTRVDALAHR